MECRGRLPVFAWAGTVKGLGVVSSSRVGDAVDNRADPLTVDLLFAQGALPGWASCQPRGAGKFGAMNRPVLYGGLPCVCAGPGRAASAGAAG